MTLDGKPVEVVREQTIVSYRTEDSKCGRWKKGQAFEWIAVIVRDKPEVRDS